MFEDVPLFNRWLNKRIPAASEYALNMRSVFIFPSGFGWLYLLLVASLFLLGTNYQNNLMLMLCYFLLALMLTNLFVAYRNFSRLHLHIGKLSAVYAKSQLHMPVWITFDETPEQRAHGVLYFAFRPERDKQRVDLDNFTNPIQLTLNCPRRGAMNVPRVTLSSYYPLGLFRCWTHLAFTDEIIVFPAPLQCSAILHASWDAQGSTPTSGATGRTPTNEDFEGLERYVKGTPMQRIAWKLFAKGRGMHNKQFSASTFESGWLRYTDYFKGDVEQTLGFLCYQLIEMRKRDQAVGLALPNERIPPAQGEAHFRRCLTALALFPAYDIETPA